MAHRGNANKLATASPASFDAGKGLGFRVQVLGFMIKTPKASMELSWALFKTSVAM